MLPSIRIQDIADILIMTFLLYQLYTWFRGTRAMQVLFGLGVVTMIYFATRFLGLYMTSWVLQEVGTVLIILVVVVFQVEIRQTLYRFSLLRHLIDSRDNSGYSRYQEIVETLFGMAAKRTGALVVFQRDELLNDLMTNGISLDCEISAQMLESIFFDGAPFHDGAILIKDGRIAQAACHLPLSTNQQLPRHLGTRHRAAVGLSERSDAVVLAISEERGEVSVASSGELHVLPSPAEAIALLDQLLAHENKTPRIPGRRILFSNLLPKISILLIVCIFWSLVATRQGQISTIKVPVRLHGIPEGLVLLKTMPEDLTLQLKSLSVLTPAPARLDLTAEVDASTVKDGQTSIRVLNSDISLPPGMTVASISPPTVRILAEHKLRKRVPVIVSLKGELSRHIAPWRLACEPSSIDIEGPASEVAPVDSLQTDDVSASLLKRGSVLQLNIRQPQGHVSLVRDTSVTIKVIPRKTGHN